MGRVGAAEQIGPGKRSDASGRETGCNECPRCCGAERESGRRESFGFCQVPRRPMVARAALHFWEEPCISGEEGSGTVFFSGCNLRCVYCQNREIASGSVGWEIGTERLSELFLELQAQGANNINLVTPSHEYPQIREALRLVRGKLKIPIISNTSSYERLESLKEMEGYLDIYLADYKYHSAETAARYSKAADYPKVARAALAEMYRQVGDPVFDERGMLKKGMIVRHLLLPGRLKEAKAAVRYLYETFGDSICLSLLNQYTPVRIPQEFPELNRKVTRREYEALVDYAIGLGVENGFLQEGETAQESFIPDFDGSGVCPFSKSEDVPAGSSVQDV